VNAQLYVHCPSIQHDGMISVDVRLEQNHQYEGHAKRVTLRNDGKEHNMRSVDPSTHVVRLPRCHSPAHALSETSHLSPPGGHTPPSVRANLPLVRCDRRSPCVRSELEG